MMDAIFATIATAYVYLTVLVIGAVVWTNAVRSVARGINEANERKEQA